MPNMYLRAPEYEGWQLVPHGKSSAIPQSQEKEAALMGWKRERERGFLVGPPGSLPHQTPILTGTGSPHPAHSPTDWHEAHRMQQYSQHVTRHPTTHMSVHPAWQEGGHTFMSWTPR